MDDSLYVHVNYQISEMEKAFEIYNKRVGGHRAQARGLGGGRGGGNLFKIKQTTSLVYNFHYPEGGIGVENK